MGGKQQQDLNKDWTWFTMSARIKLADCSESVLLRRPRRVHFSAASCIQIDSKSKSRKFKRPAENAAAQVEGILQGEVIGSIIDVDL